MTNVSFPHWQRHNQRAVAVVLVRAPNHRQLAEDLSRYVGGHSCNTWSTMSDCHSFSDFDALSNVMG